MLCAKKRSKLCCVWILGIGYCKPLLHPHANLSLNDKTEAGQFYWSGTGSNKEIKEVACTMFKAEFPIFDKIEVNGKTAAPLYKFLKTQKGGIFGNGIKWNFTKFLVAKMERLRRDMYPPLHLKDKEDVRDCHSVGGRSDRSICAAGTLGGARSYISPGADYGTGQSQDRKRPFLDDGDRRVADVCRDLHDLALRGVGHRGISVSGDPVSRDSHQGLRSALFVVDRC
uniref:Glutathione peroxidase n=1 Tax=Ananas comosus var. bracteatus TaxID=296719 RepID=A0A6V7NY20_ANACO|nr:unnamed protein product [Ananas comosus var. bracteatus]